MRKENKISIWVGTFNSKYDFDNYIKESYDEDGDCVPSIFMKDFNIEHIDHDFKESEFIGKKLTKDNLIGFSYDEKFIEKIDEVLLIGNSIILLYDSEYSGEIKSTNKVTFIGTYDYKK